MLRWLQSLFVVLFFLVMMGFLIRDHVIPSFKRAGAIEIDREILIDSWVSQDEWLAVGLGNISLGGMRLLSDYNEEDSSYAIFAHLEIQTPLFTGRVISAARLDHRLQLREARMRAHVPAQRGGLLPAEDLDAEELPAGAFEAAAYVDGMTMLLRLRRQGAVQFTSLRLTQPVTLSDSLAPLLRTEMLSKGVVYSADIYDPLWGSRAGQVELEYVDDRVELRDGRPVEMRVVEQRFGDQRMVMLVDANGRIQERRVPLLAGGGSAIPGLGSDAAIVLERREPMDGQREFPGLDYEPRLPGLEHSEMVGRDTGEVIPALSIFEIITMGRRGEGLPFGRSD